MVAEHYGAQKFLGLGVARAFGLSSGHQENRSCLLLGLQGFDFRSLEPLLEP